MKSTRCCLPRLPGKPGWLAAPAFAVSKLIQWARAAQTRNLACLLLLPRLLLTRGWVRALLVYPSMLFALAHAHALCSSSIHSAKSTHAFSQG
jgi:predicted ABC-type exoprotein transport system permease subunit